VQIVGRDEDSFSMDCKELHSFSPQLYRSLMAYPREVIPVLDDVLNNIATAIRHEETGAGAGNGAGGDDGSQMDAQPTADAGSQAINIRPYNLLSPRAIRDLDPNDIEALVQIDGLVTRVSNVTPDLRCAPMQQVLNFFSSTTGLVTQAAVLVHLVSPHSMRLVCPQ